MNGWSSRFLVHQKVCLFVLWYANQMPTGWCCNAEMLKTATNTIRCLCFLLPEINVFAFILFRNIFFSPAILMRWWRGYISRDLCRDRGPSTSLSGSFTGLFRTVMDCWCCRSDVYMELCIIRRGTYQFTRNCSSSGTFLD